MLSETEESDSEVNLVLFIGSLQLLLQGVLVSESEESATKGDLVSFEGSLQELPIGRVGVQV